MTNDANIPLTKMRYFCSECAYEGKSHFAVVSHISKSACKDAGAIVRSVTQEAILRAYKEVEAETAATTQEPPAPAATSDLGPSMAESAFDSPPPWFGQGDDESDDDDIDPNEPIRDITPYRFQPRTMNVGYQFQAEAWVYVLYETMLSYGYEGSFSDWIHECILNLCAIEGVKVELLAIPQGYREKLLQEVGLQDAYSA